MATLRRRSAGSCSSAPGPSKRIWLMPAPSSAAAASASLCASPANSTARRKLRSPIRTRYGWRRAKRRRSFSYQTARRTAMTQIQDPRFYRTPADAIAAPPERLAYVAAFDPAGQVKDAITVLDTDPASPGYGRIVGWSELPTAGNELHHFGWNACSSALCHQGHAHHGLERRYLLVPGLRSSRTYVLDTKPDPRQPRIVRVIEPEELAAKAGYSRPHTVHCGPGG